MKSNEIFIIGGALLAAILLFKGQASSSASGPIPFVSPFLSMLGKAETKAIQTLGSNIQTLQSVKESNLGIAQSILDQERSLADVKISQIQTELDKTQGYIGSQQKFAASGAFANIAPEGFTGQGLLGKFDKTFNTMSKLWTGEKGPLSGVSVFPDFKLFLTPSNRNIIAQQAQYEIAQQNIGEANQLIQRQQGEIDRLNEEYQTRFGGISRYG
jgi:hypothetical protein